jgi:hypothetical protein
MGASDSHLDSNPDDFSNNIPDIAQTVWTHMVTFREHIKVLLPAWKGVIFTSF